MRGRQIYLQRDLGRVLLPYEMAPNKTGVREETIAAVLDKKHPHKKLPPSSTLAVYNKTPIFIPMDITEDVV